MNDISYYLQVPQQHSTVRQYLRLSSVSVDTALPAAVDIYIQTPLAHYSRVDFIEIERFKSTIKIMI